MKTFEELGLKEDLLQAIKKLGFYEPTPVQEATIPLILQGKDVIAMSNTGSGKTFAFAAGIIQRLEPRAGLQAIILVPTRELAEQMMHAFDTFTKGTTIKTCAIYGGVSINPQIHNLKRANIAICTPGRTLDHLERGTIDLDRVQHIILDEADRMLDMGFFPDVKKILKECPSEKQILLFSATMPKEIKDLAKAFMDKPTHIDLAEHVDPKKLSQETYFVNSTARLELLKELLLAESDKELVIIFCNMRSVVDKVTKHLKREGIKAVAIHGGLSQNKRLQVIKSFTGKSNHNVLVCTDVAARGLDIPGVTHVYNYDIPKEPKQYVHRIGRTARAGADGKAINLVSGKDMGNYRNILKANDLAIPSKEPTNEEHKYDASEKPDKAFGGRGRGRSSGQRKGTGARKSFGKRESDDRPRKGFGSKKPASQRKSYGNKNESNERPRYGKGTDDKPKRSFGNKNKNFGGKGPRKTPSRRGPPRRR